MSRSLGNNHCLDKEILLLNYVITELPQLFNPVDENKTNQYIYLKNVKYKKEMTFP